MNHDDDDEGGDDLDEDNLQVYLVRWGVTWMIIISVTISYIILPVLIPYITLRFLERSQIVRFGPNSDSEEEKEGSETVKSEKAKES